MNKMITGQGILKVLGKPVTISFTVPEGPCTAGAMLPDAQRLANQVTELAQRGVEAAGMAISCRKGCGACCRQMVPVSPPEARHLAGLVEGMPEERGRTIRERFEEAGRRMEAAGLAGLEVTGHPDQDKEGYRAFGLAYFRLGIACPFLDEESCSIHADRPLVCREYLVTSAPEDCATLGGGKVMKVGMPVRIWAAFGRSADGERRLEWMPLIRSLAFVDAEKTPAPVRTGPEWVGAFLEEVRK